MARHGGAEKNGKQSRQQRDRTAQNRQGSRPRVRTAAAGCPAPAGLHGEGAADPARPSAVRAHARGGDIAVRVSESPRALGRPPALDAFVVSYLVRSGVRHEHGRAGGPAACARRSRRGFKGGGTGVAHSHSHTLTLTLAHTHTHNLPHSQTQSQSYTFAPPHSLTQTLTLTLTLTHSHTLVHGPRAERRRDSRPTGTPPANASRRL